MDHQDIIKIARQILNCPVCGRPFEQDKVRLTAMIDDKVVIQSSCGRDHLPIATIFLTVFSPQPNQSLGVTKKKPRLTAEDVDQVVNRLRHFDGDFQALFSSID